MIFSLLSLSDQVDTSFSEVQGLIYELVSPRGNQEVLSCRHTSVGRVLPTLKQALVPPPAIASPVC